MPTTVKPAIKKGNKRPCYAPSLDQMIEKLSKQAGERGTRIAKSLVKKYRPATLSLAFRLIPKAYTGTKLSAREEKEYIAIKAVDPKTAEKWKENRIKEKKARVAAK